MDRYLLCLALALLIAIPTTGLVDRGALYEGKKIRLPDGSCYVVLRRDPHAAGYWVIRSGWARTRPLETSMAAEDLLEMERGDYPPGMRLEAALMNRQPDAAPDGR
jgi:hypothetical protein